MTERNSVECNSYVNDNICPNLDVSLSATTLSDQQHLG